MKHRLPIEPTLLPDDTTELKLKFAEEYFNQGFDPVLAYLVVYPGESEGTARLHSKKLLEDYVVRKKIDALSMAAHRKGFEDEVDRIATELRTAAYLDPIMLFTDSGDLRPLSEIPEAARRALASIEINAIFDGEGNVIGHAKKIKVQDKMKALRMLGEWKKMYTIKSEIGVDQDMASMILDARKRYLAGELAPIEAESREISGAAELSAEVDFMEGLE